MEGLDFGYLIEGEVRRNPTTGRLVVWTFNHEGQEVAFDVESALQRYEGKEVRVTVASFEALAELEKVYSQGSDS